MTTTATRPARHAPIGRGAAHQALDDAGARAKLLKICDTLNCAPGDLSPDGIHIDMPRIFAVMRRQGYSVGDPRHAPAQVQYGYTIWHVDVTLPDNGPSFVLGYFTPNTS
jgi:hypothetical protein